MPDDELESYLAAISPEVDSARSELTGRFGSAQVFQVRLPALRIEQLRRLAEAQGVPPTSLVVDWVIERLDREDPGHGSAVPRAPLSPRVRQPDPVGPVNPVEQPGTVGGPPPGSLGRTGGTPAVPPRGQSPRPPAGRPARSSVGPLTPPPGRPGHPLGSGPLPPVGSALTEPALDPAASAPYPPAPPYARANALAGPMSNALPSPMAGPLAAPLSNPSPLPGSGPLGDGPFGTAAPPASLGGEFAAPALSNVPPLAGEPAAPSEPADDADSSHTDRADTDSADTDSADTGATGDGANQVTPIFRAGTELPDPDKRRGPRHRAPEPVTSLLTRRKF